MSESVPTTSFLERTIQRRSFFRVAGATAAASTLVLAGCVGSDDDNDETGPSVSTLRFTRDDLGVLNYAYLLEHLEAAFYQKVVDAFPSDFTADDRAAFVDLRDHEVIHREFLRYALGTNAFDNVVPIAFDFTSFNLTTRAGVYAAAQLLEDVGVGAYNGAGKLLTAPAYLKLVGKIASVESRHAAFVRDQAQPGSFAAADVVENTGTLAGLDTVKTPTQVAELIAKYVQATLIVTDLPTL
ncbi:ferritin-like domain-containing protein [Hymenobacter sp. AT01-02]|uniref:ferritin-like domain-containing protein n=1 Tax=Hymenobacter sp. AT01-02 TaxID=1571877 RepID=UPI0005F271C3|nr:ferritin-like domain-containing protein [Hymenobacter sp. AT01-02]